MPSDQRLTTSEFFKSFSVTFGEPPEDFELQAYDTAVILRKLLESSVTSRPELQKQLALIRDIDGGTGKLSMSETREVLRPTFVLTIENNTIVRAP